MRHLLLGLAVCASGQLFAQAPSSLTYSTPNVYIANVSNVFLSPNVAGNVNSYSITPPLPTGLTFNTNTGVISGIPTVASPSTSYTITANGSGGTSTSTQAAIQVTNNYFNNNYTAISFGGTGVTVTNGSTNDTITNTSNTSYGKNAGDLVIYRNVAVLSGQSIDCIVKTVSVSTGTSFTAYDQAATSGSGYSDNDPKFFAPQLSFPAGTSTGGGGNVQYQFQFILGGSYNSTTHSGLNVVLQNVKINTYDIDGNSPNNSNNYSNQYNEFGGFTTSEVGSNSTLNAPVFNSTTGLTTYKSSIYTNSTVVTADATRVRITYNNMSNFSIRVGGGGTAYFFLDFSAGPVFSTADTTVVPSVDLNTSVIGVNNANAGCGSSLSFTGASQTNITPTTGTLTKLTVSYPTTDIVDSTNERLLVNGATTGGTISLKPTDTVNTTFVLGGVTYKVSSALANGVKTLKFGRSGTDTTLSVANAESILDAFQYDNNSTTPTAGSRNFTVNVFNNAFESPDAIFTATLNCVSISGNVYHDTNGLVDSTVNGSAASQFAAGFVKVVRVNPTNNQVIDVKPISAGGAYSFGTVSQGTYALYLSTSTPTAGTVFTAATIPSPYVTTGENLGSGAGNDHATDGKLLVTIGSSSITGANFGLQIPPTTADSTISNIANPGGFNNYVINPAAFKINETDGNIDSMVINSFPTGANYLKIGSVVYTSGGNCPPQVTTCTPWPGTVTVPFSNGAPVSAISVDPTNEGTASVVLNFKAYDNARAVSNSSNLTLNFVGTNYTTISGKVWHDGNGNGTVDGNEAYVNTANSGETLYALLLQTTHTYSDSTTVLMDAPVSATTGYSFSNVPMGNDYSIQIVSIATAPTPGIAGKTIAPNMASGWTGVSTNASGTIVTGLNTNKPSIALPNLSGSKTNLNFGIEMTPQATDANTAVAYPSVGTLYTLNGVGSNPPVPSATDAEDGNLGAGKTIIITTLPQYTTLKYNNTNVTLNQEITNFNPANLQVLVTANTVGQTQTSFNFTYKDSANVPDPTPALYVLNWQVPLPVMMAGFSVAADGNEAKLVWSTYSESRCLGFYVEHSVDGRTWKQIDFVASQAPEGTSNEKLNYITYDQNPATGVNFYRLKQTDINNNFVYTEVEKVSFGKDGTVNIFPNPVKDVLNVSLADWSKVAMVRIFDMNGKEVFHTKDASNGINMSAMANGTYLLRVEFTNGNTTDSKVMKH